MCKIMIFGGTTEGRLLCEFAVREQISVWCSVTTEYGERLLPESEWLKIQHGKMKEEEMTAFFIKQEIRLVIDATHPYAVEVTQNIRRAAEKSHLLYYRVVREAEIWQPEDGQCRYFETLAQIIHYLNELEGDIFVSVGSREIEMLKHIRQAKERCVLRVLDEEEVVSACEQAGFLRERIIAKRGPFDREENMRDFGRFSCRYLVTKDSGRTGGFAAKCQAAMDLGMEVLVLKRPREEGKSMEEIQALMAQYGKSQKTIYLIGAGMGDMETITAEGKAALEQAELVIGAKRLLASVETAGKEQLASYRYEEVAEYIAQTDKRIVAVLLSGDVGFYSGAALLEKKLFQRAAKIKGETWQIKVINGISCVVYLAGRLHDTWQDMHFVSLHGVSANIVAEIKRHAKTFFLLGGKIDAAALCRRLCEYECGDYRVCIGERLGGEQERILDGKAEDWTDIKTDPLSVALVYNPCPLENPQSGLGDEVFVRGAVPMTKAEIRAVVLSKLAVKRTDICYDLGCGTGSVTVEMAGFATEGKIYAIDRNREAIALTQQNCHRFGCDNVETICGDIVTELTTEEKLAAEETLAAPDKVFIGGGGQHLSEIFDIVLAKNSLCKIVLTAVSVETLTAALTVYKSHGMEPEITQIAVTRTRKVGEHTMFDAQNPVFVIWGEKRQLCIK